MTKLTKAQMEARAAENEAHNADVITDVEAAVASLEAAADEFQAATPEQATQAQYIRNIANNGKHHLELLKRLRSES